MGCLNALRASRSSLQWAVSCSFTHTHTHAHTHTHTKASCLTPAHTCTAFNMCLTQFCGYVAQKTAAMAVRWQYFISQSSLVLRKGVVKSDWDLCVCVDVLMLGVRIPFAGSVESEPYRLYNLDVFEYLHESPFGLYGSIPYMVAHKQGLTTGVLW